MKYTYLSFVTCLLCLFTACEPYFNLNAPYKDVTVVYGILNYQDSIHYVKIYKGFQSYGQNGVYLNAQNPDSIYYNPAHIDVVLQEYRDNRPTGRRIKLETTDNFPRDTGIFYYGDERIIYYTKEEIKQYMSYKIIITNLITGKVTEGQTPIVGDFIIEGKTLNMIGRPNNRNGEVSFGRAEHAAGYEIHVNFVYFEVDKNTNQVVKTDRIVKNVTPVLGEKFNLNAEGRFTKSFPLTFYDDIAAQLKYNPDVIRYAGSPNPTDSSAFLEVEGWAAGESMIKFLLSNQPTNSFTQINILYTNMKTIDDELAFGFLSSKVKSPITHFGITYDSEDSLVKGPKTGHLGFRYRREYTPYPNF